MMCVSQPPQRRLAISTTSIIVVWRRTTRRKSRYLLAGEYSGGTRCLVTPPRELKYKKGKDEGQRGWGVGGGGVVVGGGGGPPTPLPVALVGFVGIIFCHLLLPLPPPPPRCLWEIMPFFIFSSQCPINSLIISNFYSKLFNFKNYLIILKDNLKRFLILNHCFKGIFFKNYKHIIHIKIKKKYRSNRLRLDLFIHLLWMVYL